MKIVNQRSYALSIGNQVAQPGDAIDVPDDVGKRLLDQPANWAAPKTTKKSDADDGDEKESNS